MINAIYNFNNFAIFSRFFFKLVNDRLNWSRDSTRSWKWMRGATHCRHLLLLVESSAWEVARRSLTIDARTRVRKNRRNRVRRAECTSRVMHSRRSESRVGHPSWGSWRMISGLRWCVHQSSVEARRNTRKSHLYEISGLFAVWDTFLFVFFFFSTLRT